MLKGAYLLFGQLPESGSHSVMEHVYQLCSLCCSQRAEGKLTWDLKTKPGEASRPAVTRRTVIQALTPRLHKLLKTQNQPEWGGGGGGGDCHMGTDSEGNQSFQDIILRFFVEVLVCGLSVLQCTHICQLPIYKFLSG